MRDNIDEVVVMGHSIMDVDYRDIIVPLLYSTNGRYVFILI